MITTYSAHRGLQKLARRIRHPSYAGLAVPRRGGLINQLLNSLTRQPIDLPNYENALIAGLKRNVRPNDRVVVIGGGLGVTATIAAQLAAPFGHVICFEGGKIQAAKVKQTAIYNEVGDRLNVYHAFVGPHDHVYSDVTGAIGVLIEDLPPCDVLELDCEGAEVEILTQLKIRPRAILVESHGMYGAPSSLVGSLLEEMGYEVENLGVAEIDEEVYCEKHDVFVLMATKSGASDQ